MRYLELVSNGKSYTGTRQINEILEKQNFHWLIDSEIEGVKIEIKNSTLIWHDGDYLSGNWHYGIFKGGNFYGKWENGIFENGNFKGKWQSGIKLI